MFEEAQGLIQSKIYMLDKHLELLDYYCRLFLTMKGSQRLMSRPHAYVGFILLDRVIGSLKNIIQLRGSRDALLIARSMVEAAIIYHWIGAENEKEDADVRASRYMLEGCVEELLCYDSAKHTSAHSREMRDQCCQQLLANEDASAYHNQVRAMLNDEANPFKGGFIKRLTNSSVSNLLKAMPINPTVWKEGYEYLSGYHHQNPLNQFWLLPDESETNPRPFQALFADFYALCFGVLSTAEVAHNFFGALRRIHIRNEATLQAIENSCQYAGWLRTVAIGMIKPQARPEHDAPERP